MSQLLDVADELDRIRKPLEMALIQPETVAVLKLAAYEIRRLRAENALLKPDVPAASFD